MASSARLDELKKKFEENPRRYFAPLANEHRKSGDLDQAIALCRTHLPLQPGHISGHIVLAQALFEAGALDESREIFHTALGLDPENLIALRYLGDIAKAAADIDTARQWYQRVLEVDPRNEEIVQLVRDLDSPAAAAPAPASPELQPDESTTAPAPAAASNASPPPPASEASDARFAPLSLDELDIDGTASSSSSPNASPTSAGVDATADWEAGAGSADLSMLETPDLDPFDLDPAGSFDALLESAAPAETEDFFLTELAASNAPTDGSEPDPHSAPDLPEDSAPYADAQPATEEAPAEDAAFEEGAFYLEPPPPEPPVSDAETEVAAQATAADSAMEPRGDDEQVSMPGLDAFAAEYSVSGEDLSVSAGYAAWATPEAEDTPNAESLARFAEQETAEWQPPAPEPEPMAPGAQAPDGLGLEVMEFVPPSREPSAHAAPDDADPLLGHTLDAMQAEESGTPAAFVTETMAELYLQQGFRNEALAVYRELLSRNPGDANLRDRIEQIEIGSASSIGMAAVSENVVESARRRQTARPTRSVRSFFASLAGRRVVGTREMTDSQTAAPAVPDGGMSYDSTSQVEAEQIADTSLETSPAPTDDLIAPLPSAAETLASFDPFADVPEPEPVAASHEAPNAAPSAAPPEAIDELDATDLTAWAAPTAEVPAARPEEPESGRAAAETPEPGRSLENLFPETPVTARTEATAQTFATAFGRSEPQGRPTRAASNELSLDHVFRGAPEGAPQTDGGFSFDQFFSDSRSASTDAAAPAATAHESGRDSGSGDAHDIEQFTAWLEGLKKK